MLWAKLSVRFALLKKTMPFVLPKLDYFCSDLEPYIDAYTVEIHHDKHHQAYTDKLNDTLNNYETLGKKPVEWLLKNIFKIPEKIRNSVKKFGGGYYNHNLYWKMMKRDGGGTPPQKILDAINKNYEDFDNLRTVFNAEATKLFGSGWTWLVKNPNKTISIVSTSNQDNPIMENTRVTPILGIDLWEHSYYLKYKNKRIDYISAWWNIVNWDYVEELFNA